MARVRMSQELLRLTNFAPVPDLPRISSEYKEHRIKRGTVLARLVSVKREAILEMQVEVAPARLRLNQAACETCWHARKAIEATVFELNFKNGAFSAVSD